MKSHWGASFFKRAEPKELDLKNTDPLFYFLQLFIAIQGHTGGPPQHRREREREVSLPSETMRQHTRNTHLSQHSNYWIYAQWWLNYSDPVLTPVQIKVTIAHFKPPYR